MSVLNKPRLAPSLLSADFADLAGAIRCAEEGGADALHLDVMDGHFVPNISFGPALVRAVRQRTKLPLDIHLMISEPAKYLEAFAKAGGDTLVIHVESQGRIPQLIAQARALGKRPGIAISPDTPLEGTSAYLPSVEEVIVMSVYPGFSGQSFLPKALDRLSSMRKSLERLPQPVDLSVDGGVTLETGPSAARAGANFFVCGNSVYANDRTPQESLRLMRGAISGITDPPQSAPGR